MTVGDSHCRACASAASLLMSAQMDTSAESLLAPLSCERGFPSRGRGDKDERSGCARQEQGRRMTGMPTKPWEEKSFIWDEKLLLSARFEAKNAADTSMSTKSLRPSASVTSVWKVAPGGT